MEIKVMSKNERLEEAYGILIEKVNAISDQYQLSYFELYGIMEAVKCDLFNQVKNEEDEDD